MRRGRRRAGYTAVALALLVSASGPASASASATTGDRAALVKVTKALHRVAAQRSLSFSMAGHLTSKEESFTFGSRGITSLGPSTLSDTVTTADPDGKAPAQRSRTIVIGRDIWARVPEGFEGDDRPWLHMTLDAADASDDQALPFRLLAAARTARRVGREPVHRRSTTRFHLTIDYRKIARSGPKALRATARAMLQGNPKGIEHDDVWVDDHGDVRRTRGTQRSAGATAVVRMDLLAFGVPLDGIEPPPADQVTEAEAIPIPSPVADPKFRGLG